MNMTVLIVEDEDRLAELLTEYLQQAGFATRRFVGGLGVVDWVRDEHPDLILLDLMLPGKDGMEICKEVRAFSAVPIIMITARVEEIDRVLGLELGADDYICKPFSLREVVARVKAVLRRAGGRDGLGENDLVLDETSYRATLYRRKLDLTAVEFQLLVVLARAPGRIYSRAQLMELMYQDHRIVEERTIDSHILKLRKKMAQAGGGQALIHSIYGVGYKFERL